MAFSTIGDLASSLMLNRSSTQARRNLSTLSQELTTGLKADRSEALRGDLTALSSWENLISTGSLRKKTLAEGLNKANAKQAVLETLQNTAGDLANKFDVSLSSQQSRTLEHLPTLAKGALDEFVSKMNLQMAGQSLFAGSETDGLTYAESGAILSSAKAVLSGAVTTSDIHARLDTWLADASDGTLQIAYLGDSVDPKNVRLDDHAQVALVGRGNSPALASNLRSLVLATLANDTDLNFSDQVQHSLLGSVAVDLRSSQAGIIQIQAELGATEFRISEAKTFASASDETVYCLSGPPAYVCVRGASRQNTHQGLGQF